MHPWERRLRDLSHLLRSCGETYFSPDLFRQNTNQFLQTSRTVTFLIQKSKDAIPDFSSWYKANVLQPWAVDPVMTWAKEARNFIEKEGDLDLYSTLRAAILYSYDTDEDLVLEVGRTELLQASVDQLLKTAIRVLPRGLIDVAVLKIQRRWVANTLPDRELIFALTYTYSRLHHVCTALAEHLGSELDSSIPHPTSLDPNQSDVAKVRFLKISKPGVGRHSTVRIKSDPNFKPSPALLALKSEIDAGPKPSCLSDVVAVRAKMAKITFEEYGNHVPMLALFDKHWNQVDFMSTALADQSEKYIFWRNVADRAFYLKAYALVWTSETWLRDLEDHQNRPIEELPIVGEQLNVVGADASGGVQFATWTISRTTADGKPELVALGSTDIGREPGTMFFIKPVVAAMRLAHADSAG